MAIGDKSIRFDIEGRNKTTKAFREVNSSMSKLTGAAGKLAGVLTGAFATGQIVAFNKTIQAADAIGKFADRAGVTTDELQKMRYAFDLAGVGVEAVDKALLTFGKRLGKAHQGIGALKGGLKGGEEALLEMLMATDNQADALNTIFHAMGQAETQTRKLAIADAAFGQAGLRMTAAFRDGSEQFFKMKNEANSLGVVLEESMIRKSEELNDQMTRVSKVIKVNVMQSFEGLFPLIMSASNAMLEFSMSLRGLSVVSGQSREMLTEMLAEAKSRALLLEQQLVAVGEAWGPAKIVGEWWLGRDLEKARKNVKHLETALKDMSDIVLPMEKKMGPVASATKTEIQTLFDVIDFYDVFDDKLDEHFKKQEQQLAQQKKVQKEWDINSEIQMQVLKARLEGGDLEVEILKEKLALEKALGRNLSTAKPEWGYTMGGLSEVELLEKEITKRHQIIKQIEMQNRLMGTAENIFDRWGDGMLMALQRGENAFESFKNTAVAALFDIGREMMKLMIFDPIKQAASGPLRGLANSIGSAIGGSLFGGGGSTGGNTDFTQGGFAKGGFVHGRSPILVGEKGPEIFMPSGSGHVVPNNQIGGGTNVTLNITTGVQSTVRAEIMGLMPLISEQVKAAVAESRQRGGSFSAAMGV